MPRRGMSPPPLSVIQERLRAATGPHLDFRIRKQGQFVNPDKLIIPRDQALDKRRMADYKLVVHAVDAYLTGKDTASYDPDTWFKDED